MEPNRGDSLGKLLPKAISEKRRRRRQRQHDAAGNLNTTIVDSDGTNSLSNMGDDDDDYDNGSFGSFESGGEPARPQSTKGSRSNSRNPSSTGSRSPSRPVSSRPSSLRATHTEPQSASTGALPSLPPPSPAAAKSISGGGAQPSSNPDDNGVAAPTDQPPTAPQTPARAVAPSGIRSRTTGRPDQGALPSLTLPANVGSSSPAIISTPPTPVQQPSPTRQEAPQRGLGWKAFGFTSSADEPASRTLAPHKRSKSASATAPLNNRFSSVASSQLTPPLERNETSNAATGFFSSVLSAAQNAANNLSTNIQNSGVGLGGVDKSRTASVSQPSWQPAAAAEDPTEPTKRPQSQASMDQKESAIRTLGAGDLSLSQLGVVEPPSPVASPASGRFADADSTRARSESAPADAQTSNGEFIPEEAASRPRSLNETPSRDATPPLPQVEPEERFGLHHSGSMRSYNKTHRKRGSSVTTSGTGMNLGMPLSNVPTSVAPPAANLSTPKLTGFAIASKKRNRDFHSVFKSIPDDDYLIEDYSCALQREILAHGRLYVSEGHLCFSSNILGWMTTLVMSFDEIVSVEKRSTALVFKNGLMISTLHAKHVFASFTSRDATYDLIVNIWKLGHPTLTSTLNGVQVEGTGGDKTEKLDAAPLESDRELDSETEDESNDDAEEFYVEDDDEIEALDEPADLNGDGEPDAAVSRKASGMTSNGIPATQSKDLSPLAGPTEFPGPATHPPTECGDASSHFDKVVGDDVIAAPLGKVYNLMFGQSSAAFMTKFLSASSKCTDVQIDDKKGLSLESRNRSYTYVKPLNSTLGPKQAKCIISESLDALDFEKAATVTMSTQTPDVPSGNLFLVKTKYCLSWAENNGTRILVNCTIEWSGKSWIKGPIEKAAADGQADHCKAIFASLRTSLLSRSRAGTGTNGGPRMKRKGKKGKVTQLAAQAAEAAAPIDRSRRDWGALEPVHQLVEPLADMVKPLLTGNVMYGLLVGLLVAAWFGFGFSPRRSVAPYAGIHGGVYGPDRLAAYEEMWRREESELWDWLEERVGMERLGSDGSNPRRRVMQPRSVEEKMREDRMDAREMEEALRVTQEKLRVLQEAMGRVAKEPNRAMYEGV